MQDVTSFVLTDGGQLIRIPQIRVAVSAATWPDRTQRFRAASPRNTMKMHASKLLKPAKDRAASPTVKDDSQWRRASPPA